ncbi:MAG: MBL fold metallo-hydrolase [Gammaproteobacteria bacterium]|nr:MBL fold metallo-hydrolase [Gammaproteobacteria bacterium]
MLDNVYAIIGPLENRTPQNLGNNATFGFIVGKTDVLLIDPGGTYQGAKAVHDAIKKITGNPISIVINTGTQDHRWLGNSYFKKLGAKIIASAAAVADQKHRARDQFILLGNLVGDKGLAGTDASYADQTFESQLRLQYNGLEVEIHAAPAHSPGDSFVWIPSKKLVFSGDIIYVDRLLSLMSFSNLKNWILAFQAIEKFKPNIIIPGHGKVTDLTTARQQTQDYLMFLRDTVSTFMESGGQIEDVGKLDQSRFRHLSNFDDLKGRNIQKVYEELEFE